MTQQGRLLPRWARARPWGPLAPLTEPPVATGGGGVGDAPGRQPTPPQPLSSRPLCTGEPELGGGTVHLRTRSQSRPGQTSVTVLFHLHREAHSCQQGA